MEFGLGKIWPPECKFYAYSALIPRGLKSRRRVKVPGHGRLEVADRRRNGIIELSIQPSPLRSQRMREGLYRASRTAHNSDYRCPQGGEGKCQVRD
jgi:hypothetical protein